MCCSQFCLSLLVKHFHIFRSQILVLFCTFGSLQTTLLCFSTLTLRYIAAVREFSFRFIFPPPSPSFLLHGQCPSERNIHRLSVLGTPLLLQINNGSLALARSLFFRFVFACANRNKKRPIKFQSCSTAFIFENALPPPISPCRAPLFTQEIWEGKAACARRFVEFPSNSAVLLPPFVRRTCFILNTLSNEAMKAPRWPKETQARDAARFPTYLRSLLFLSLSFPPTDLHRGALTFCWVMFFFSFHNICLPDADSLSKFCYRA